MLVLSHSKAPSGVFRLFPNPKSGTKIPFKNPKKSAPALVSSIPGTVGIFKISAILNLFLSISPAPKFPTGLNLSTVIPGFNPIIPLSTSLTGGTGFSITFFPFKRSNSVCLLFFASSVLILPPIMSSKAPNVSSFFGAAPVAFLNHLSNPSLASAVIWSPLVFKIVPIASGFKIDFRMVFIPSYVVTLFCLFLSLESIFSKFALSLLDRPSGVKFITSCNI